MAIQIGWFQVDKCGVSIMMTSPNRNISALLALCEGKRPVTLHKARRFWAVPEQTIKRTIETLMIWDDIALIITPPSRILLA